MIAIFLFGATVGNFLRGLPIGPDGELRIGFLNLLNAFSVWVGVFTIVSAAMHGSLYLGLKTDGDLQQRIRRWTWRLNACLGMPFVLAHTAVIYWVFRGKVEIGKFSY